MLKPILKIHTWKPGSLQPGEIFLYTIVFVQPLEFQFLSTGWHTIVNIPGTLKNLKQKIITCKTYYNPENIEPKAPDHKAQLL